MKFENLLLLNYWANFMIYILKIIAVLKCIHWVSQVSDVAHGPLVFIFILIMLQQQYEFVNLGVKNWNENIIFIRLPLKKQRARSEDFMNIICFPYYTFWQWNLSIPTSTEREILCRNRQSFRLHNVKHIEKLSNENFNLCWITQWNRLFRFRIRHV